MNKGNDSFQLNNNITDYSSNQQIYDSRVDLSTNQKITLSTPREKDIQVNFQSIKQRNVLNEFKATLAETEKYTSILNSNITNLNISKSMLNQINENNHFKSNYDETIGDTSSIANNEILENDDNFARLKISNDVLLKTNLDLRNTNKILQDEIEAYKNSSVYKSPYSQYDLNLNEFISNIKQALNTSQMANIELQDIVFQTQKKAETLSKANNEIIKHYETIKTEYEIKTKEVSELRVIIGNKDQKIEHLNITIQELNNKIKQLNDQIIDNEKQINFQMTINASYNKYKEDTEEMLTSLNNTIGTLQKGNTAHISKSTQFQQQIDDLHSQLMSSESIIEKSNNEIRIRERNHIKQIEQFEEMDKTIQQLKETISNKQNEIRQLNGNIEKLNAQLESLNLFIEDREKTISTLKASLSILTKTFDNDLSVIKNSSNDSISVQMILSDKIEHLNEKIINQENIIKQMNEKNEVLRQDCVSFKKEINDYINQFEQNQYEYQLLYQKYEEQTGLIETLKVEFLNKRKDKELMDLIKANEEILKKLQKIQEENNSKTQEINELKSNYSKISRELFEAQRLNTTLETQNNYNPTMRNHNSKNAFNQLLYCEINDLEESVSSQEFDPMISINNNQTKHLNTTISSNYYLYTMIEINYVISFNLKTKRFARLTYNDKSGTFKKLYDNFTAVKVNFNEGLFILNKSIVFYFNPRDNSIKQVAKLVVPHIKSNAIYINNELYILSGENTKQCQKVSLSDWRISQLPEVNYIRSDGGVCFVDNKYLFVLFGECEQQNTIERLNIKCINSSWEIMKCNSKPSLGFNILNHFLCFSNDYKIMITGGINEKRIGNQSLIQYDYKTEKINHLGESQCFALFNDQITQLTNKRLATFDIGGNVHIFDQAFTTYEVFEISFRNA